MKFFVAFSTVLVCAFAAPSAYSSYASVPAYYSGYGYSAAPSYNYAAQAPVTVLPSGFLADTPEVAHAKAAHLAEKAKVASKAAYVSDPYAYDAPAYSVSAYPAPAYPSSYVVPYTGSYTHAAAEITVLPSGYLADTPEVAHAKAAHFAEKSKAAAAAAASPEYDSYSHSEHAYTAPYPHSYSPHY